MGEVNVANCIADNNKDKPSLEQKEDQLEEQQNIGIDNDEEDKEEVYVVRQKWGYCAIAFSIVQSCILLVMLTRCGIAPMRINPMLGPYPDALSQYGGKNSALILYEGEWWRLITPIQVHAGVIHLICNIAVQLDLGALFEKEWGSLRWLAIYLASAILGSAMSIIFKPDSISVGSSGAIMGLFGAKLSEVLLRRRELVKTNQQFIGMQVRREQCIGVSFSVILVMLLSFVPGIDWAAHLGGLMAGFLVGIAIFSEQNKHSVRCWHLWFCFGVVAFVVVYTFVLIYVYSGRVNPIDGLTDVCQYYKERFENYECQCTRR